ncbi:hypothetical protein C8Q76DRAFT_65274 [Earliella scabrosa]|nr:hypothetical protein C8Q76DRAFT_65274 [Earliella scabrosa]
MSAANTVQMTEENDYMDMGPFSPPQWLRNHSELRSRNIVLTTFLSPFCAWRTDGFSRIPQYAVKIVDDTIEADIYDQLHRLEPTSPNHTLPCHVIRDEHQTLIMPCLDDATALDSVFRAPDLSSLLGFFRQVVEGVEFLHSHNIAHMDMCNGQLIAARERDAVDHPNIEPGKVYIIDYGASRRLELGPGHQPAVELPETQCKPPLGMKRFDPYSWDVYCTGVLFKTFVEVWLRKPVSWIARWYIRWLIGNERGCSGVCHCRPTARRARQVLAFIQGALRIVNCAV